jgi:hypothetical protein
MTLKKLFVLGSILGGAALLRDKTRRDRFMASAQDWWSNIRSRLDEMQGSSASSSASSDTGSASMGGQSTFGAGATSRSSYSPSGGNGIY